MENPNYINNTKLNPNFVTGLTDAEGCLSVCVWMDNVIFKDFYKYHLHAGKNLN